MKHANIIKSIFAAVALLSAAGAWADTETVDGIEWHYTITDGKATIYNNGSTAIPPSTTGAITIPSSLAGYPVTSIGGSAFRGCIRLTSVTIPDSVTRIGGAAFYNSGLTSVSIPDSVTSIGNYAFYGCSGLTSVTIPDGVTSIGNYAFCGCSGLTSVSIPDSVTSIGIEAFRSCSGLASVSIPDGVTSIVNDAFWGCSGLTSVSIPDGVTSIGDRAFFECSGLTGVVIPNSVTSIGDRAFYGCSGLTSVTIPDSVTSIGIEAFRRCSGMISFIVGDYNANYKSINGLLLSKDGAMLIYGVNGDVMIPASVTSILNDAFWGCSGLTSVTIPDGVKSIGSATFYNCSGMVSFIVGDNNPNYKSINGLLLSKDSTMLIYGVNGDVIIPDGVTSIGSYAFRGCSGLTSVAIPNGVTSIGPEAFRGCSGLTSVAIPDSVTSIGGGAFYGCSRLTSVTIPDGMTSIETEAFRGCSGLTSVMMPDSVTSIGGAAFYGCSGLTSVTIPDGMTSIGDRAFFGCSGLTSVTIPDGVTSIGDYAFNDCSGLMSFIVGDNNANYKSGNGLLLSKDGKMLICGVNGAVMIPDSVERIGNYAFHNCSGLTSVSIPDSVTSIIGSAAFWGCSGLMSFIVGDDSTNYKSINGLLMSKDGKTLIYGVNGDVMIPDGVESIGYSAFYGRSGLTSVTIPDSVTSIGSRAFFGCSGLTSVAIPDGVTSIGSYAFNGCSGLTSMAIPDGVTIIEEGAFSDCSRLTSVVIPDGVTSIGDYAFKGTALDTVYVSSSDNIECIKGLLVLSGCDASAVTFLELPEVKNVKAKQRWPWNGLVDITCDVAGIYDPNNDLYFVLEAVDHDSGITNKLSHFWVVKDGKNSTDLNVHGNGNYRFMWDAHADFGEVVCTNMVLSVAIKTHDKVQLWEGGPYWATTNVGAEKPEDYGYYFWWGDTVGYKWENEQWVASDGSTSNFQFYGDPISEQTCLKGIDTLKSEGWITASGVLALAHDAAHVQWGGEWRMPAKDELEALSNNCDWIWATTNGVDGYIVRGKGDYASASIFLPAAGYGNSDSLVLAGLIGYFGSSVPDGVNCSWWLYFESSRHSMTSNGFRGEGRSVRPVQGFAEAQMATITLAGDSAPFQLDTRTGVRECAGEEPLTYSSLWDGDADAMVTIAQDGMAIAEGLTGEGEQAWSVQKAGTYVLTHTTYTNGVAGKVESATFNVPAKDIGLAQVNVDCSDVTYRGVAYEPAVQSVKFGNDTLVAGTDFTLAYSGNVNAGTATITLTGINFYNGTYTTNFTIRPRPLTQGMVGAIGNHPYTGKEQTPKPMVTDAELGVTLREDVEYTLSYANNTAIGDGIVTVTGKGNYTGSIVRTFVIEPSSGSELEESLGGAGKAESDGAGGWIVTITNDVDAANLPIEIPDDLGNVTIDLSGHDLVGGDGDPVIRIVPGHGDGEPTRLMMVTSGGNAIVQGGEGAQAIEVAEGAQDGVSVDVGDGVVVRSGVKSEMRNVALGFEEYVQGTELAEVNCSALTVADDESSVLRIEPINGSMGNIDAFTPLFTSAGTNCLSVKTTFGKPCAFALKEDKSSVEVLSGQSYYVDFLARFTAFDETPDSVAPYATQSSGRAILQGEGMGFALVILRKGFVCYIDDDIMLWRQEELDNNDEPVGTNWWVRAGNGNGGTADYMLTSMGDSSFSVGDDDWYRVTFKACRDEVSGKLFFNIFLNGKQVRAGDTTDFPSMTDRTSIATVRFEGQGNVDNIVSYNTPPVCIRNVTAKQRWPWNGKVDISFDVVGDVTIGLPEGAAPRLSVIISNCTDGTSFEASRSALSGDTGVTERRHHVVWDAWADLGEVGYSNIVVRVALVDPHDMVQLWEGGPYWATTNIGAEEPWNSGYYFWWGDTVGYTRSAGTWNNGDGCYDGVMWVSSTGQTMSSSPFSPSSCTTYYIEDYPALKSAGYIDSTGNLVPAHDAAHVHWGGNWRMPTIDELRALESNCDWTWATKNGVNGYIVRGRDAYAANSIFLPCSGSGYGSSLYSAGSGGDYWSSVPTWGDACGLAFNSGYRGWGYYPRSSGLSVRPVQGFAEAQVTALALAGDSEPFPLDTRTGIRESDGNEALTYSSQWDGDVNATVMIAQDGVAIAEGLSCEGEYAWSVQKAGTYVLTHTTYTNGVAGKVETAMFKLTKDIASLTVGDIAQVTYTGSAIAPNPTVTDAACGYALVKDTDYTLSYANNAAAGTATVTITGKGCYTGSVVKNFTIAPRNIADAVVTLGAVLTYNGVEQVQAISSVKAGGLAVTYTVSGNTATDAGTYMLTATGTGNFTGTVTKQFSIARKSISGATVTLAGGLTYTGSAQSQEVSAVTIGGLNATFDVSGNTATSAGNYTLTVTGTGNFTGSTTRQFTVAPKQLTAAMVGSVDNVSYTGSAHTPEPVVTDAARGVTLAKGSDYALSYANNTAAGTATVTVTGRGNYSGTIVKNFTIAKQIVVPPTIVSKEYTGGHQLADVPSSTLYDIAQNAGGVDVGQYDVKLRLVDSANYAWPDVQGSDLIVKFAIDRKSIVGATVTLGDTLVYSGAEQEQLVESVKIGGLNATFDVSGNKATDAGAYALTVAGTGNFTGAAEAQWKILPGDIIESAAAYDGIYDGEGHGIAVTVTQPAESAVKYAFAANGPYADDAILFTNVTEGAVAVWYMIAAENYTTVTNSATVKISPKALTDAMVSIEAADWGYDGTAKEPAVTVKDGEPSILTEDDYDVEYSDNVEAGEATVTVTGKRNYTGAVVKHFTIRSIEETVVEEAFAGLPVTVTPDGNGGLKVTLTNDVDIEDLPIEIPDNVGTVTIDLNGHDLVGDGGRDGARPPRDAGEDGKPAIVIVRGDGEGEPTVITIVNSGEDAVVRGGEGGAGNPGGNGAPAIVVAEGVQDGVLINIGEGVAVQGGVGGASEDGTEGVPSPGIVGEIGTNEGVVLPFALTDEMVGAIAPQPFTGTAVTPPLEIYDAAHDVTLVEGADYVLCWADNIRPGMASVTVTGKGDYLGEVTRTFAIGTPVEATLVVGEYFKATLAELGCDVPTDGTPYNVVAKGLPAGLKLKYNAAVKNKKGKVVRKAKFEWWIEGVPTAEMDFFTNPPYLVITVGGVAGVHALPIEVVAQEVTELPDLALGQTLDAQDPYRLPGVNNGWTVTGLPTGLKYATKKVTKKSGKKTVTVAEAYSVYGKTTKAGLFTITAKKKVGSFYETMKYRVLVRPKAVDTAVFGQELADITTMAYVPVNWDLTGGSRPVATESGGRGATALPVVSNVAKVAGLPSGVAFAAKDKYKDKKKTQVKQRGQTIVGTPTKPGTYVVTFTKNVKSGKKTVAKTAQILWTVVENDAELSLRFNTAGGVVESGAVGLNYGDLMAFTATRNATVTASGLPKGMSLVRLNEGGSRPVATESGTDATGRVPPVSWGFTGFTTKAGTYLVTVTATLNGKSVTQRVALKVDALPDWAKGTFNGVASRTGCQPVQGGDANAQAARCTSGLATITVSSVGKISGKFSEGGTNWTFSAVSFNAASRSVIAPYQGGSRPLATEAFIASNVVAKYSYKVKSGKKTLTKTLTRAFTLTVSSVPIVPDVPNVPVRGVATMIETGATGGSRPLATEIEAWQNLWSSAYKALGKTLFTTKSGKKTLAYRMYTYDVCTNELGQVLYVTGEADTTGLTHLLTLSMKVTSSGAVTATMSFDTGKMSKGKAVVYKATCSSMVIPLSAADAEEFEGVAFLYFAPSSANGFPGFAGAAPL